MSLTPPDIPELDDVPPIARSALWVRAVMRSTMSPVTHTAGIAALAVLAGGGAYAGTILFGATGFAAAGLCGLVAAWFVFFKVIVPLDARRQVRVVKQEANWEEEFGAAIRAHDKIQRVIAADRHRQRT
jgi:hypothetical protein